jgi:signal transduction histidine kinase
MRERVAQVSGQLGISCSAKGGVTLEVRMPLAT